MVSSMQKNVDCCFFACMGTGLGPNEFTLIADRMYGLYRFVKNEFYIRMQELPGSTKCLSRCKNIA